MMRCYTYILLALVMIGCFISGYFYAKNKFNQFDLQSLAKTSSEVRAENAPVKVYKDIQGVEHKIYLQQPSLTKKEVISKNLPYIDSVAEALSIKAKQLESVTTISTETRGDSIPFLQKKIDSLQRLVFFYNDKYLRLTVRTNPKSDTLAMDNFDFQYNDSLSIRQYWNRKSVLGLNLGSKQYFTDISSTDPRTTIGGLKTITIKQNMPSVGFRIQAVTNFNFITHSLSPGVGFRFDAHRFSLNGIYYFNTSIEQWVPVVGLRYDIIQF
jgi:hypothetical protein